RCVVAGRISFLREGLYPLITLASALMVNSRDSIVLWWCPICVEVRYPDALSASVAAVRVALYAASNRRSWETAATLASLRSRSTIVSRFLISSRLVGSVLSQPYSTHSSKLIFVSDHEYLFAADHRIKEMISARELCLELGGGIDGGVYCSPKRCF